ncbi:SusE domain-containing protein [Psychroserpens sp. SPM9]|uniref:SusE domain-containing protein n=1 Tax=Psychroserpens sp. SPM9 TaxID=2975598 RepID=UPI0021A5284A|nr:SusE domain-containing protein [Psychroserpens sp. SPM9]MDG5490309.1 SusE domain-containing protein [Psychroserpens sp. SPM9]
MKNIKFLTLLFIALLGFNACETEDDVVFVAEQSDLSFSNAFQAEYVLTAQTAGNLAERFTWDSADAGVPTNFTYELQSSILGDFSDAAAVGSTSANEIAITVGDMLGFAAQAGLDNDPETEAPNTGSVSFRLRAFAGTGGLETFSAGQALTMVLPEGEVAAAVCEFEKLYLVGAGVVDAGWSWDTPVELPCVENGIYGGNVAFQNLGGDEPNNNFRFFTVNTDWGSGRNYPFYADAGYTIDAGFENAMDDDSNFGFVGTTGTYYLEIDTNTKTITLSDAQATGTCEFDLLYGVGAGLVDAGWSWDTPVQILCSSDGVYTANVALQNLGGDEPNNNFRFFTVNTDWGSGRNYPFYEDDGYTFDSDLVNANDDDSNFAFLGTTGTYLLTIDTVNKTITLD